MAQQIAFGLDIGAASIKLISVSHSGNGFLLDAALAAPSPQKGMLSESTLDQEQMAKAIKKVVEETRMRSTLVNIALPETHVYTRVIEMPVLSDKELSSAIYWEAEQYIPVPLASLTIDYKVLFKPDSKTQSGEKMSVLLVGAPTQLIDKYQHIFSLAGLTISGLETEILSVVRALAITKNFPNTLIINIGALSSELAVVKAGNIISAYSLPTGGIAFTRAIAADFGFTIAQAEEYKKSYGISEKNAGGKIGESTAPLIASITTEAKKVIAFYNEKYKNETQIQQILLSGGSAKMPGINLFFAQNCGIETAIANPLQIFAGQQLPKEIIDNAPDYTIALGLALRDYE